MGHVIFDLHLAMGCSVLLQMEGVGHAFSNHHISKCSGPHPLYFLTSPLSISDDKTREELLFTHDLTLTKTIDICCAKEAASLHMKALKSEEINKVTHNSNKKKKKKSGDSKHKAKGKSGDHRKGKRGGKENPGNGKSGETSDLRATKRKCLFFTQLHLMKKELCPT